MNTASLPDLLDLLEELGIIGGSGDMAAVIPRAKLDGTFCSHVTEQEVAASIAALDDVDESRLVNELDRIGWRSAWDEFFDFCRAPERAAASM